MKYTLKVYTKCMKIFGDKIKMKSEMRGLYLAVILSVAVIFITNIIFPKPEKKEEIATEQTVEVKAPSVEEKKIEVVEVLPTRNEAISTDKRISFENEKIKGSIRIKGARIDELSLKNYKKSLDTDSELVDVLSPAKTETASYADFGFVPADPNIKVPNSNTVWNVHEFDKLTSKTPIVFEWDNGQGIKFVRTISVDKDYMFVVSQTIENHSGKEISLYPYALIHKNKLIEEENTRVVHTGGIAIVDRVLKEFKFDKLKESKELTAKENGWAGFTDRYWFSAIIPDNDTSNKITFSKTGENKYQVDVISSSPLVIPANDKAQTEIKLFSGAKEISLLDSYKENLKIEKFDLAVDFGWYYFLTKPFFYILEFLYNFIGNMGWAILLFAAILRLIMLPIAGKSYESMSKMKKFQPKIQKLQELYADDKVRLQQETMNLYKKEKINPASGCLPILIQIPVFFSLYKVLNFAIEIRHAPFIGWIKDLSAPDPMTISRLLHFPIPTLLNIGVWPIFMGITMFIQQKLSPAPANKDQARMFALMPILFTFMLGHFASGLVIYWTLSNILSITQQRLIMKKYGV